MLVGRIISNSNFQMALIIAICKLLIWQKIEAINSEEIKSLAGSRLGGLANRP